MWAYTGTDAVPRSYSTKGHKSEQPKERLQPPVLQGDPLFSQKQKNVQRPARAQRAFKRSALFAILRSQVHSSTIVRGHNP